MKQYWRNYIPILLQLNRNNFFCAPKYNIHKKTDVYEFGVYQGTSMREMAMDFAKSNIPVRKFFGFDTFTGMPIDPAERELVSDSWLDQDAFNAAKHMNLSVEECARAIEASVEKIIPASGVCCITGKYEDSLTNSAAREHDMKPALYVDIDCDFGKSAYEALDFCFKNRLIVPGTIIGYDDWSGTKGWETNASGESKAHLDITKKYNVCYDMELSTTNKDDEGAPLVQKLFRVSEVGGQLVTNQDPYLQEWMEE